MFNNAFYAQKSGLAMGSPLSPLLAEIFMDHLERKLFKMSSPVLEKVLFWFRYVDDCLAFFSGTGRQLDMLLGVLNGLHPNIKFTVEVENNGSINFLDLTISRSGTALSFGIFRKPTHCDTVIPAGSKHPPTHKAAAFNSMAHRLHNVPLNAENYKKEVDTMLTIGWNNGYTTNYVMNIISKHKKKKLQELVYAAKDVTRETRQYTKIPYVGDISLQIGRIIERSTGKLVSFSTISNLGKTFINCKDRVENSRRSGVYQLDCIDCNVVYIGQTGRNFKERMNEHRRAVGNENCNSAFSEHLHTSGHTSDFSNFKILHNCSKGKLLDRLECIEIKKALVNNVNIVNDITFLHPSPLLDLVSGGPRPPPTPTI